MTPEQRALQVIEVTRNPEWVHYEVLFKMAGIDPQRGLMAIPFLYHDRHYNVPAISKIRVNVEDCADELPEVPLKMADAFVSLPLPSQGVDLLVLNHGLILNRIFQRRAILGEPNNYVAECLRVIKPGGLFLAYDYSRSGLDPAESGEAVAKRFGLIRQTFPFAAVVEALRQKTGKPAAAFEDFFAGPGGDEAVFLKRP